MKPWGSGDSSTIHTFRLVNPRKKALSEEWGIVGRINLNLKHVGFEVLAAMTMTMNLNNSWCCFERELGKARVRDNNPEVNLIAKTIVPSCTYDAVPAGGWLTQAEPSG
jgi:hypothetical protein